MTNPTITVKQGDFSDEGFRVFVDLGNTGQLWSIGLEFQAEAAAEYAAARLRDALALDAQLVAEPTPTADIVSELLELRTVAHPDEAQMDRAGELASELTRRGIDVAAIA